MNRKLYGAVALLLLGMGAVLVYKLMVSNIVEPNLPRVRPITANSTSPAKINSDAIRISIASSNTKEDWLRQVTTTFNAESANQGKYQVAGRPINVQIIKETVDGKEKDYRSGTMIKDTLSGKIKPTIISPGSESWIAKFNKEWKALTNLRPISDSPPILVRTPIVIAMWRSRAKAFGCYPESVATCSWQRIRELSQDDKGWEAYGRPEWGRFTFGYGYFGESNSGTLGILSMCMVGLGKQQQLGMDEVEVDNACGKFIGAIEGAKVHSGKSDIWLLERMISGGQDYLDAVITYESNVIKMNRKHGRHLAEPLVAIYPQDGTVFVGHPFAILDATPWVSEEQLAAAKIYRNFLLDKPQQQMVLTLGLRPADETIAIDAPIDSSNGANPEAKLIPLTVPDPIIMDRIGEVWHSVKKKAVIVIAFDKSGSMKENGKISAARLGAKEFVTLMGPEDILVWLPFDGNVYQDKTQGFKYKIGEDLVDEITSITAGGETALYDAILTAMTTLHHYRNQYGATMRYGLVVLSDGMDTDKGSSLARVEATLQPQESNPDGIQIHTVCIGADCDEPVLRKVANAAHGRFWKGNSEAEMVKIYRNIATHY